MSLSAMLSASLGAFLGCGPPRAAIDLCRSPHRSGAPLASAPDALGSLHEWLQTKGVSVEGSSGARRTAKRNAGASASVPSTG